MKKIIIATLLMISALCLFSTVALAAEPLDRIHEYVITVTPQADGTLFIDYYIKWEVLNDKREGPLTYVKIGVPNSDHRINSFGDNVEKATSLTSGGAWVRLDFKEKHYAGDIVEIRFSIWQNKLIERAEDGMLVYNFVAGWFDDTPIVNQKILWQKTNVSSATNTKTDGNYLVWQVANPALGEKLFASVIYHETAFQTTEDSFKAESHGLSSGAIIAIILGAIVLIIIIVAVIAYINDGYDGGNGYGGGRHSSTVFISSRSSCARSSCASSCASHCACACACAGGGRVGCTRKTVGYTRPTIERVQK